MLPTRRSPKKNCPGVPRGVVTIFFSFLGVLCLVAFLTNWLSVDPSVAQREKQLRSAPLAASATDPLYRQPALDYKPLGPEFTDQPWWEQFDSNRTIYLYSDAGTCNTLRNVASALTYAYDHKVNVKFLFQRYAKWQYLFDFPVISTSVLPDGATDPRKSSICETVGIEYIKNLTTAKGFAWTKNPNGDGEIGCLSTCCWREEPFGAKHMWFFRVLRPVQLIQEMMDTFKAENEWDKYMMVGVHVRRSDNVYNLRADLRKANGKKADRHHFNTADMDSMLPLENYVARMKQFIETHRMQSDFGNRLVKEIRFFLATDSTKARDYISSQFEVGVVQTFERSTRDKDLRKDVLGTRLGVIDLFLLGSCEAVIGTPQSTFSETATWFRGIPLFYPVFGQRTTTEPRHLEKSLNI